MIKRILLFAMLAALLLGSISCTNPGEEKETSDSAKAADVGTETDNIRDGYDVNGYLLDDVPEGLNFDNAEVNFLIWSEHSMTEFFSDGMSGDLIGDEIFERNDTVERRLGVELNFVSTPGNASNMQTYAKKAQIDVSSGACEFDIYASYSRTTPLLTLNGGILEDLNSLDYIDFDKPWWPDKLVDECLINNKLYFCTGDISTSLLWMTIATFFNKDLIETQNLEDPYEIVANDKWTIDKLIGMTLNKYEDRNGNGVADINDFFGYTVYNVNTDAFFTAAGFLALEKNNSGEIIISPTIEDQRIHDLLDKLGDWFTNTSDLYHVNDTAIREVFFNQRSIFTMDRVFIVAGKDNSETGKIEFGYGILPNPKYDENQVDYVTNIGYTYTMYGISTGAFNTNACAAVLECLASDSYRNVTPLVFETAMKVKYASDPKAAATYDILRATVSFDLGRLYSGQISDVYKVMRQAVFNNTKTFASQYKSLTTVMNNGVKTIFDAYLD